MKSTPFDVIQRPFGHKNPQLSRPIEYDIKPKLARLQRDLTPEISYIYEKYRANLAFEPSALR